MNLGYIKLTRIFWYRNRIEIEIEIISDSKWRKWYDKGSCYWSMTSRYNKSKRFLISNAFQANVSNAFKGKFVGAELVISGPRHGESNGNNNRTVLRNKKLVPNIVSNSFYDSGWKWLSFRNRRLKSLFALKMYGRWNVCETTFVHFYRSSIELHRLFGQLLVCCIMLHSSESFAYRRTKQLPFFIKRQRKTRFLRAVELFPFLSNWSFLSLSFLIVTLRAIVITIVRVPLHNRGVVTIKISRWQ